MQLKGAEHASVASQPQLSRHIWKWNKHLAKLQALKAPISVKSSRIDLSIDQRALGRIPLKLQRISLYRFVECTQVSWSLIYHLAFSCLTLSVRLPQVFSFTMEFRFKTSFIRWIASANLLPLTYEITPIEEQNDDRLGQDTRIQRDWNLSPALRSCY